MTLFVDVAFPRPLLRSYTYAIPAALSGRVRPGVRVRASLGRQTAVGVAVRVHDEPPAGEAAVKEIAAVLDEAPALPLPILAFTRKLAAEQAAGWGESHIRVATKYPATTRRWFAAQGIQAECIKLNGAMEIAPKLGLASHIVDLVSTGRTLVENALAEQKIISDVSARLIVNRAAFKLRSAEVPALVERFRQAVGDAAA